MLVGLLLHELNVGLYIWGMFHHLVDEQENVENSKEAEKTKDEKKEEPAEEVKVEENKEEAPAEEAEKKTDEQS